MPSVIQPSFALGELSDDLSGRVDLEWYGKGLSLCENFYVLAAGGVTFRPGTQYLGEAGGPSRLMAFEFNASETYALLFEDRRCRFIRNGGFVLGADLEPYQIATPYAASELADIRGAQSADVIYLVHPNHPPAKLMRYDHSDWRYQVLSFGTGLAAPAGVSASTSADGGVVYRYKITAANTGTGEESPASAEVSVSSKDLGLDNTTVSLEWQPVPGANEYRIYKHEAGMWGLLGYADKISNAPVSVYAVDAAGTRFQRLAKRYDVVRHPDGLSIFPEGEGRGSIVVYRARAAYYSEASRSCLICARTWCKAEGVAPGITGTAYAYEEVPEWGADIDHPQGFSPRWSQAAPLWTTASAVRFSDANYAPDTTISPPVYENPFQGAGNYPSVVAFIQQRLCFAGTANDPQKIWMSRSGNFENFGRSNPTRDDDAVYLTISSSQVNWIRGLVSLRALLAMTGGGEWSIDSGAQGGAITPSQVGVTQQSG